MAREIKFRGKTIPDRQWVFGYYVKMENETKTIQRHAIMDVADTDNKFIKSGKDYQMSLSVVDSNTIGQFTGLHDKNGNEIYEGDIMGLPEQDANGVKYKNRYVRTVEWVNDGFFLVDNCMMGGEVRKYGDRLALEISLKSEYAGIARFFKERGLDYTVIGNIYDNPELLKQED